MNIRAYIEDKWDALRYGGGSRVSGSTLGKIGLGLLVLILLYYPVGMLMVHRIDDDTTFRPEISSGQSQTVANAVGLVRREVDDYRWTSMDPFFMPGAALDNMPNYQQGIISAISRFAIEMSDQIGRVRGASQVDGDLDKAAGLLKYKPDVWVYDISESLLPTRSSAEQYRLGADALASYNQRLGEGQAVFEKRADNLLATLDRFAADLGSASAVIDNSVRDLYTFSTSSDDVFYRTKGRLYAYYLLLEGLKADYAQLIAERNLETAWDLMLASMREAAEMDPLVVINGDPDAIMLPSHLAAQGFYLLRARTQLREISNILLK
ncbi:DUF2333 family protein [Aestuariispira insulae]|uniref:Uncharacterized protein DUF2333 n=1 Tax=Aestuariispira insulae TaxID=1461337 RepID=A0A3D9HRI2_9PROT|nr:DUF2333 family protein [Aestuariispira insulae]RED51486.1 uncharacterized protein DUF2333 [Aestuariispira insulae]